MIPVVLTKIMMVVPNIVSTWQQLPKNIPNRQILQAGCLGSRVMLPRWLLITGELAHMLVITIITTIIIITTITITELQKRADREDQSVPFFLAGANFWENARKHAKTGENRRKTGAFLVLIFLGGKLVGANFYAFCNYVHIVKCWLVVGNFFACHPTSMN